ncbi:MAG: lipopolysaccharide heptosyltransferase II [candidate division NC10 bacterium]|nr:lipopolysaccharide heptosyltransferase II [candidate division NC10 bacterium]
MGIVLRDIDLNEVRRILLIKPSSIGDVVHTLPTLAALRKRFPDRYITWVVEREAAGIVQGHPDVDQILVSGRKGWQRALKDPRNATKAVQELLAFVRELRAGSYDLAIDLQGLFKSAILTLLSGARYRVGFAPVREMAHRALTHSVPYPHALHAVERYLSLARCLGADGDPHAFFIATSLEDETRVRRFLSQSGISTDEPKVVLHSSARWGTKLWEEERFGRLGDLLAEKLGARILLTGSEADGPITARIAASMRHRALNLAGKLTLKGLVALLKQTSLLVTVDSGPMHIAAALGTPLVALFGPTDPRWTGPYGPNCTVLQKTIPCRPCLKRRCQIAEERLCMRSIDVEEVLEAALFRYGQHLGGSDDG